MLQDVLNPQLKFQIFTMYPCFIWLRDMHTKEIGTEVFGELRNVVLEENGENGQRK